MVLFILKIIKLLQITVAASEQLCFYTDNDYDVNQSLQAQKTKSCFVESRDNKTVLLAYHENQTGDELGQAQFFGGLGFANVCMLIEYQTESNSFN